MLVDKIWLKYTRLKIFFLFAGLDWWLNHLGLNEMYMSMNWVISNLGNGLLLVCNQGVVDWTLQNKLQWNLNWSTKLFCPENAFKDIGHLLRPQWVKLILYQHCVFVSWWGSLRVSRPYYFWLLKCTCVWGCKWLEINTDNLLSYFY